MGKSCEIPLMEEILNNHQTWIKNPCKLTGYIHQKKTGAGFLPLTTVGDVL